MPFSNQWMDGQSRRSWHRGRSLLRAKFAMTGGLAAMGRAPPSGTASIGTVYVRDQNHLQQAIDYIHLNPVMAGLVATAESWHWSSAHPGNANLPIGG